MDDYNSNNSERIERYLRRQMTADEAAAFKADLQRDADLRNEAQAMAMMIKAMRQQRASEAREIVDDVMATNRANHAAASQTERAAASISNPFDYGKKGGNGGVSQPLGWRRILKVAAMVAVVVGIGITLYHIADHLKTGNAPTSLETSAQSPQLVAAQVLFDQYYSKPQLQGNSTEARELEALIDQLANADDETAQWVTSQLQVAYKHVKSQPKFKPYMNDIEWYLALAYVKLDKLDEAQQLLTDITSRKAGNNPYLKRERQLLQDIKQQQTNK